MVEVDPLVELVGQPVEVGEQVELVVLRLGPSPDWAGVRRSRR